MRTLGPDWKVQGCRDRLKSRDCNYPGIRVCHEWGGGVCVGSLCFQNPQREETLKAVIPGELIGGENLFAIRRFVNEREPTE